MSLINIYWSRLFSAYIIFHLPRICSDHSPLLISVVTRASSKSKVFHFENYWLEYPLCHNTIRKAWNFTPHSTTMHRFTHILSRTRKNLNSWISIGLNSPNKDIQNVELQISNLDTQIQNLPCFDLEDASCTPLGKFLTNILFFFKTMKPLMGLEIKTHMGA